MEPKTLDQIRTEVFDEWSARPGKFTPYEMEEEIAKRFNAQFPATQELMHKPWTEEQREQRMNTTREVQEANQRNLRHVEQLLEPEKIPYQFTSVASTDVITQPDIDQPWVVKGMIPEKEITLISGSPGCGKSFISLHFALCISCGVPAFMPKTIELGADAFAGFLTPNTKKVLYIDEENPEWQTQKRIKKMVNGLSEDIRKLHTQHPFYIGQHQGLKIDQPEKLAALKNEILAKKIEVVIIDTFLAIHNAEENSAKEVGRIYDLLKELGTVHGNGKRLTFILLHHNRKMGQFERVGQESARGSNAILGMVGSHILVHHDWLENRKGIKVTLTQTKTRDIAPFETFEANIEDNDDETMTTVCYGKRADVKISKVLQCQDAIMEAIQQNGYVMRKEILEQWKDYGVSNKKDALRVLLEKKIISEERVQNGRKRDTRYTLKCQVSDEQIGVESAFT